MRPDLTVRRSSLTQAPLWAIAGTRVMAVSAVHSTRTDFPPRGDEHHVSAKSAEDWDGRHDASTPGARAQGGSRGPGDPFAPDDPPLRSTPGPEHGGRWALSYAIAKPTIINHNDNFTVWGVGRGVSSPTCATDSTAPNKPLTGVALTIIAPSNPGNRTANTTIQAAPMSVPVNGSTIPPSTTAAASVPDTSVNGGI